MHSAYSLDESPEATFSSSNDAPILGENSVIIDIPLFQQSFRHSMTLLKALNNPSKNGRTKNSPNHPYIYEMADYLKFIEYLSELETLVVDAHEKAVRDNKEIALNYLDSFNNKLAIVIIELSKVTVPLSKKLNLIDELIISAKPSPALLEYTEPVISPIVGLIGGILGFVVGIPVGAVMGVCCLFYVMMTSASSFTVMDGNALLVFMGLSAVAGVCYGAYVGATQGANYLWSLNHNAFFKPSKIQDLTKSALLSKTMERFFGLLFIKSQVNNSDATFAPVINDLVSEFIPPDDKEEAFKRNRPLLRI
jgi:hypothetical protein